MIELVLSIAVLGFLVYMVLQIPMPAPFKNLIIGLVILLVIMWLLHGFGYLPHLRFRP